MFENSRGPWNRAEDWTDADAFFGVVFEVESFSCLFPPRGRKIDVTLLGGFAPPETIPDDYHCWVFRMLEQTEAHHVRPLLLGLGTRLASVINIARDIELFSQSDRFGSILVFFRRRCRVERGYGVAQCGPFPLALERIFKEVGNES